MARAQATRQTDLPAGHSRHWPWILAALVLGAVALIMLRPSEEPAPPERVASPTQPPAGRVVRDVAPPAAPRRPGDLARSLIARVRTDGEPYDLPALAEQARRYQTEARLADAHLLFYFTAREGHAPSALTLGTGYDPLHFQAENSLMEEPDAVQALKWYRLAAEGGEAEASARLEALKGWAEQRAQEGDEAAERLLLAWPDAAAGADRMTSRDSVASRTSPDAERDE